MAERVQQQLERMGRGAGFIAALDQSGGSTPKALALYGVPPERYAGDDEMFDLVHAMRTRIVADAAFDSRVLGAILFQNTLDRSIDGLPSSEYLWQRKGVVPFLKVDYGLAEAVAGVQTMKPVEDLAERLPAAKAKGVFGTKMRSVIGAANAPGIRAVVAQQFALAAEIIGHGLVPIVEPEVAIDAEAKAECEALLRDELRAALDALGAHAQVMLKLTLPEAPNFYAEFCEHRNVLRVAALSGGYSRALANDRLAANQGVIASFSRALTEGLHVAQSDEEFSATLAAAIDSIAAASAT